MARPFVAYLFCVFVAITSLVPKARGQSVILGVLEDVPGVYYGDSYSRKVRVVFQKKGNGWTAFPNNCADQVCLKSRTSEYPDEVAWTIAFDGRNIGSVTGRTPKDFGFYAHIGLQDITSSGAVPTVGKNRTTASMQW